MSVARHYLQSNAATSVLLISKHQRQKHDNNLMQLCTKHSNQKAVLKTQKWHLLYFVFEICWPNDSYFKTRIFENTVKPHYLATVCSSTFYGKSRVWQLNEGNKNEASQRCLLYSCAGYDVGITNYEQLTILLLTVHSSKFSRDVTFKVEWTGETGTGPGITCSRLVLSWLAGDSDACLAELVQLTNEQRSLTLCRCIWRCIIWNTIDFF